jgi:hypothetical protein
MYLRSCVLVVEQLLEANEYARRALFDTSDFAAMRARERESTFRRLHLKAPPGKTPSPALPGTGRPYLLLPRSALLCPALPFPARFCRSGGCRYLLRREESSSWDVKYDFVDEKIRM